MDLISMIGCHELPPNSSSGSHEGGGGESGEAGEGEGGGSEGGDGDGARPSGKGDGGGDGGGGVLMTCTSTIRRRLGVVPGQMNCPRAI